MSLTDTFVRVGGDLAAGVPADTTGRGAAKGVPGRKRGLSVDVLGLVIAVVMLAAFAHDNFRETRNSRATCGGATPCANNSAPSKRTCSL
jgi:hypothetical protein